MSHLPTVHGILETALPVNAPAASADFYRRLFGFGTLLESERLIALDAAGQNVLLLFLEGATDEPFETSRGIIPGHGASGRSHLAFSIEADEIPAWRQRLAAEGVELESTVTWDGESESLYFRDPDEHLVELMTPGFWHSSHRRADP